MLHEYGIYDVSAFAAVLRYDPSGLADYVASLARCAQTTAPKRAKSHTASQTTSMTAHPALAVKPQTRVYEVMLAQWITSTARAAAGKAQHTATPVRGVVGRRLALQRHFLSGRGYIAGVSHTRTGRSVWTGGARKSDGHADSCRGTLRPRSRRRL